MEYGQFSSNFLVIRKSPIHSLVPWFLLMSLRNLSQPLILFRTKLWLYPLTVFLSLSFSLSLYFSLSLSLSLSIFFSSDHHIILFSIMPQDKSYLRMLVMKLSPRSLQFILTSDRLSARLLALPEGVTLHLFSFSQLAIGSIKITVLPFSLLPFFLYSSHLSSHLISFHIIPYFSIFSPHPEVFNTFSAETNSLIWFPDFTPET